MPSLFNLRATAEARIADCVHYCAFRYGHQEPNPYESYLIDLARGISVRTARARFIEFLRYYRPRHFGEALGCDLSKEYPLWSHPWRSRLPAPAWRARPEDCPDILTHFSTQGILSYRIDEEFVWLERAYSRIEQEGYRPEACGFVLGIELRPLEGPSSFILSDGNHRVAALSALGANNLRLRRSFPTSIVQERNIDRWPQVRSGLYTRDDARRVFNAYRQGNAQPRTDRSGAKVLAPAGWEATYE